MSEPIRSTRSVEAELQIHPDGQIYLRFCDAQVAQWDENFETLADWADDKALASEIASEIENAASDLAESLVRDLRERILAHQPSEPESADG